MNIICKLLYCRLLVRSVGLLGYEEDVERLLLETVSAEYKKGVRQIRHNSSNKLNKIMRKMEANSSDEQILLFQVICNFFIFDVYKIFGI